MSDDLVKRLRNPANVIYFPSSILFQDMDVLVIAADRIEELEKENFILAATQCPFPDGEGLTGSPSGHAYCAKDEELEGCDEYIQSLIKTIDEADANTEYYIDSIEELEYRLNQERKAHEKDIYVWQDNYASLEAKLEEAVGSLEKLARLGNGDLYGNSDGNMIARATLAELKGKE